MRSKRNNELKPTRDTDTEMLKGPKGCYRILWYICEKNEAIVTQIMTDIPLSRATITKNIKWLKGMDLIREKRIVGFPTRKILSLTREGRALIPKGNDTSRR